MIEKQILSELRRIVGKDHVLTAPEDLVAFGYDGTFAEHCPDAVVSPASTEGVAQVLQVAGIFDFGNKAVNDRNVYVTLRVAQSLLDLPGGVSSLELNVDDPFAAERVAMAIHGQTSLQADSWIRTNEQFFSAIAAQTLSNNFIRFFVALTAALVVVAIPKDGSFDRCVITEELPVAALKVALATPHRGHLFNQYAWGGSIIWAARDRLPVFIDGRADMYGERHYREYQAAIDGSPLWRQVFAKHDIGVVIITQGSPLTLQLENEPAYRRVYGDEISMVYVRDEPAKRLSRAGSGRGVRHAAGERLGGQGC